MTAPTSDTQGGPWVVSCPDYTTEPMASRQRAERRLEAIRRGAVCGHDHELRPATEAEKKRR